MPPGPRRPAPARPSRAGGSDRAKDHGDGPGDGRGRGRARRQRPVAGAEPERLARRRRRPTPPTAPHRAPHPRSRCPRHPSRPSASLSELLARDAPRTARHDTAPPRRERTGPAGAAVPRRPAPDPGHPRRDQQPLAARATASRSALVATTSLSPEHVLIAYRTRLAGRGMDEHGDPAARSPARRRPRSGAADSIVTVTVTPARLRTELLRPRLPPRRGRVSRMYISVRDRPASGATASVRSSTRRPRRPGRHHARDRVAADRRLVGVGLGDPAALPHRRRRPHAGGVRPHRRALPGRQRAGPPRRRLAGGRLGPPEVGRLPRLRALRRGARVPAVRLGRRGDRRRGHRRPRSARASGRRHATP